MANLRKSELEEYVDAFVDDEIMDEKAERTYTKYKRVCQRFIDFFSEEEITKRDLIAYKHMLIEKYSIKTINNYLIIVNKFIKYVELSVQEPGFKREKIRKYISSNTLKLEKEQEKRSVDNVLEPNEFKRMERMAKKKNMMRIYYVMKIIAYTGIRIGELKYFTVENLSDRSGVITVRNKGKTREIPVRGDLKRELLRYAKENEVESGPIFKGTGEGGSIDDDVIRRELKKVAGYCRGIDMEKVHPHSLRHMFGQKWVEENGQASLSELASIMGHSNVNTTAIYTQTTKQEKKRKLEKIKY